MHTFVHDLSNFHFMLISNISFLFEALQKKEQEEKERKEKEER